MRGGGVDGRKTSIGVGGAVGPINAPTVFNSVFNVEQFWDGRAATLQDQAGGPPLNPIEMASKSRDEIIAKLEKDPQLKAQFLGVYPQGFSGENITDAIAEFEKTLITPDSPFDKWLRGDENALTAQQKKKAINYLKIINVQLVMVVLFSVDVPLNRWGLKKRL